VEDEKSDQTEDVARPQIHPTLVAMNRSVLVFTILMCLIMGGVGGAGTVYVMSGLNQNSSTGGLILPVKQKISLEESSKFVDVAKAVSPSVVAISVTSSTTNFFGQTVSSSGGGTGFVISSDGLIATNKHVVSDANGKYTVKLADGSEYSATVKDLDPIFDFAIIKIDAKNLKPVDFGDSDALQVGQWVMAIGNALAEFQNTVTVGVVSAKERTITASDSSGVSSENLEGVIQTDAAINSGNSGGTLVTLDGKVVGVTTAMADAQSIAFAIPSNVLEPAVNSVIKTGHIERVALGVRYTIVDKETATADKLPVDHGAKITNDTKGNAGVISGGSADKAGLKVGDIITAINDQVVDTNHGLVNLVQKYSVGQKIKVTYWRDGKEQSVDVTLQLYKS
jgi:S1-C subfamily serine protease